MDPAPWKAFASDGHHLDARVYHPDGWVWRCLCGWSSGPGPGAEDRFAAHLRDAAGD